MMMSSTGFPLRGMRDRWDVSSGGGLMLYWTLGVHLIEKYLELGGALLRNSTFGACKGVVTGHICLHRGGSALVCAGKAQARIS